MKRRWKILLIIVLVLAVLSAAGSFALNRWLQSPETHARVEREIGEAIRMPLKLGKITFSAWSGVTVDGIAIPAGDGKFFEAAAFSVSPRYRSLLRGVIGISEVRIVRPRVHLSEAAAGGWHLPEAPKAVVEAPIAPPVQVPVSPSAPAPAPAKPKKRPGVFIAKVVIADAGAELFDKNKQPFAAVSGLNATFADLSEKSGTGEFAFKNVTFPGYATLDRIRGKLERNGGDVALRDLVVDVCGGRVRGDFTRAEGTPASAHLTLENVNIGLLGKEARARIRNASGVVTGDVQLAGIGEDPKALTGNGKIMLTAGRCTEIELVRQLGEVLRVAAIAGFEVRQATAIFQLAAGRVMLSPMDIASHPLGMSLTGGIAFDGAVDLVGTLRAPADYVAKGGLIGAQFSPPDANGQRGVSFDIKGTLDKPRQNLAEKLTGTTDRKAQRIIAAESIISALIEKKLNKPKPEAPKPAPAPAAQP